MLASQAACLHWISSLRWRHNISDLCVSNQVLEKETYVWEAWPQHIKETRYCTGIREHSLSSTERWCSQEAKCYTAWSTHKVMSKWAAQAWGPQGWWGGRAVHCILSRPLCPLCLWRLWTIISLEPALLGDTSLLSRSASLELSLWVSDHRRRHFNHLKFFLCLGSGF